MAILSGKNEKDQNEGIKFLLMAPANYPGKEDVFKITGRNQIIPDLVPLS